MEESAHFLSSQWEIMKPSLVFFTFILVARMAGPAAAQDESADDLRRLLDAIERLSAATAPGGGGADEYAQVLADDYSRWTLGSSTINDKATWVDGVRGWFEEGWRVADRTVDNVDVEIRGDLAFARRLVRESYVGPDGSKTASRSAVAEVWTRESDGIAWKLLRVDIHPLDSD
jgi:ketosteroid isomerase-like protein